MFRTLYAKLALALFLLLAAVGLLYAFISATAFRETQEAVIQRVNEELARDLVFERNLVEEGRVNEEALQQTFDLYMTINPGIEIYLLDAAGNILSYSADPAKIRRERVSLEPVRHFLRDAAEYPILGDDPRSSGERKVFSVTPLPSSENIEGYLYVVLRGEAYEAAQRMTRTDTFFWLSAWAVAISLGFGLVFGLVIFRLMTRRLEYLSGLVERFEVPGGDQSLPYRPVSIQQPDELDRLGMKFDRMARRIADQVEQLREQDAQRRQLVANVSHDLRTPLTSMRGYLESLKTKGDTLSDSQREEFLRIALDQGERLSRLIDELFELAALDAREEEPQPEPFASAELIHDVARKHHPAADARGVGIEVDVDISRLPAFVVADLAMTERVLDNLIDNALAHTPRGGHVELRASADDKHLQITVADNGPGIPADEKPHLFEPFARGNEREARGHAGIGLAIARRIMELQSGSIEVRDRDPRGAEFVVTLPLVQLKNGHVIES